MDVEIKILSCIAHFNKLKRAKDPVVHRKKTNNKLRDWNR